MTFGLGAQRLQPLPVRADAAPDASGSQVENVAPAESGAGTVYTPGQVASTGGFVKSDRPAA